MERKRGGGFLFSFLYVKRRTVEHLGRDGVKTVASDNGLDLLVANLRGLLTEFNRAIK